MIRGKSDISGKLFSVCFEMREGLGEDFYMLSSNEKFSLIGVCDGCGGIGSRKYSEYGNKSGAYISSRAAAEAALEWFDGFAMPQNRTLGESIEELSAQIKERIVSFLADYKQNTSRGLIKGSLSKSFPTTISLILTRNTSNGLETAYIWAGDSRGFYLSPSGLVQITRDDIKTKGDALSNLRDDGSLSNFISSDGDFRLNHKAVNFKNEGILIASTDGCFDYFKTPMEFEFMLLYTMSRANGIEKWQENIKSYMESYASDDYTICFALFGYESFKTLKKAYKKRLGFLENKYIKKLKSADDDDLLRLWNEYKKEYYGNI